MASVGPVAQFPPEADQPLAGAKTMFIVYVLKSLRNQKRYVGYTGKDVEARLKEHNTGSNKYTRQNGPFEILYVEEYDNKATAIRRERFLKSGQGRKFLDKLGQ